MHNCFLRDSSGEDRLIKTERYIAGIVRLRVVYLSSWLYTIYILFFFQNLFFFFFAWKDSQRQMGNRCWAELCLQDTQGTGPGKQDLETKD